MAHQFADARAHFRRDGHRFDDFQHDFFTRQEDEDVAHDHVGIDVDETERVANDLFHAQLGGVGDDGRRGGQVAGNVGGADRSVAE
ncbi:hypothetical protein D3C81_1787840 [compost metagenome]